MKETCEGQRNGSWRKKHVKDKEICQREENKKKEKKKKKVSRTQNRTKENETCETERYSISASAVAYGYSTAVYMSGYRSKSGGQMELIPVEIKIAISQEKSQF